MPLHRNRRAGLSLVEVLVALFIMALGMIALLTLFPLGAFHMGQALKDDRCATSVGVADNYMRSYWKTYVLERPNNPDPFTQAFTNPRQHPYLTPYPALALTPNIPGGFGGQMPTLTAGFNGEEPSYPVFVDPRGFEGRRKNVTFAQEVFWVAGRQPVAANQLRSRIPRRTLAVSVENPNPNQPQSGLPQFGAFVHSVRNCTLLDDLTYDENASTRRLDANGNALPVERQGRYTWAWMLRRPRVSDATVAEMTVVVYDSRNPDYPANDGEMVYGLARFTNPQSVVQYTEGGTTLTFTYPPGDPVPNVRAGQWILDGTTRATVQYLPAGGNTVVGQLVNVRLANFYRVTGVEIQENPAGGGTVQLDLQTPIKPLPGLAQAGLPAGARRTGVYNGDLYVLKGVAEVFERKPLTPSTQPDGP